MSSLLEEANKLIKAMDSSEGGGGASLRGFNGFNDYVGPKSDRYDAKAATADQCCETEDFEDISQPDVQSGISRLD